MGTSMCIVGSDSLRNFHSEVPKREIKKQIKKGHLVRAQGTLNGMGVMRIVLTKDHLSEC